MIPIFNFSLKLFQIEISPVDSRVFWTGLYVSPVVWSFFFFLGVISFKFENLPLILAAITMNMANVYGYTRCSSSANKRMQSLMEEGIRSTTMAAMSNNTVTNWIFNSFLNNDKNQPPNNNNNNSNSTRFT